VPQEIAATARTDLPQSNVLVQVQGVKKYFRSKGGAPFSKQYIKAVDDVSFDIMRGETFGLVGESGCGKSTLGRAIIALYPLSGGKVIFEGQDIEALKPQELKAFRQKMQFIFQDPSASLNPRVNIGNILMEPFRIHNVGSRQERQKKIEFLLDRVGLSAYHLSRYPHELSGGQKQRVGVARALALDPRLIICDEAVSSLDVSIQAQVINLLEDLQRELSLTYLFISHNLSVINHISDRIGVMYLGKMVEIGNHQDIYERTLHPYAKALISAIPHTDPANTQERILLKGDVPSPANPPSGCRFHTRCSEARERCSKEEPCLMHISEGHYVACHLYAQPQ
jgi:peptide/nickel transport system ATP-binding protein/oligopeptide transport system ATP-binding protein